MTGEGNFEFPKSNEEWLGDRVDDIISEAQRQISAEDYEPVTATATAVAARSRLRELWQRQSPDQRSIAMGAAAGAAAALAIFVVGSQRRF